MLFRSSSPFAASSSGELYLGVAVSSLESRRLLTDRSVSTGVVAYESSSDIVGVTFVNVEVRLSLMRAARFKRVVPPLASTARLSALADMYLRHSAKAVTLNVMHN